MSRIIQHSEIHHFVDDTNLLHSTNSIKKITNRYINHDLNLIVHWLRAHRISLNVEKTEIIFRPKAKDITKKLNFRISGQKIHISKLVKYLGLMLDESLTWSSHISMLKAKLSKANGLLAKLRFYTSCKLLIALTTIYNDLFESHMRYGCQIWGQTRSQHLSDLVKLQKKAVRILSFDEIANLKNCFLVLNVLNNEISEALQELFKNITNQHYYNTRAAYHNKLNLSQIRLQSIKYKSAKT